MGAVRQPAQVEPLAGQRRDHDLGRLVAVPADLVLQTRSVVPPEEGEPVGLAEPLRVGRVTPAFLERVHPADVVEVVVRRHGHDRSVLDERSQLRAQIADPVAGIHDEVAVAPADMPDVRFEEEVEVILDEQRDRHRSPARVRNHRSATGSSVTCGR